MDEKKQKDVKKEKAHQKRKSPRSPNTSTQLDVDERSETSENTPSDFSFSISVTPPLLPENNGSEQSISENIEIDTDIENDRSLHEIDVLTTDVELAPTMGPGESSVASEQDEVMEEKRRKVQDVLDDILRIDQTGGGDHGDLVLDFESATIEQSFSKIRDLQELLSNKDEVIQKLTEELTQLKMQFENFSTFSSNTSTTEYKALPEEFLFKRDVENIRRDIEAAKNIEVAVLKTTYEDKVEEIMKNNDIVLLSLENKYVEQIDSLKHEVESLKVENSKKSSNSSASEEELAEVIISYERRLAEQVASAKQDLYLNLEIQIQHLLDNNGEEDSDSQYPTQFLQLREIFTKKFQADMDVLKERHAQEIVKLKEDHERFIIRSTERQNRRSKTDAELIMESEKMWLEERNNLKKTNQFLQQIIHELAKYLTKCEDELNNTIVGELLKDCNDDDFTKLLTSQLDDTTETADKTISPCDSLNASFNKLRKVHFAPDISNIITLLDQSQEAEIQKELSSCLERLKSEASEILLLTSNYKKEKRLSEIEGEDDKVMILTEKLANEVASKKLLIDQMSVTKALMSELQTEKSELESQLQIFNNKNEGLRKELERSKLKIQELVTEHARQKEIVCEGYGESGSTNLVPLESPRETFTQALERAKIILDEDGEGTDQVEMLAMIESLCRAGLRAMEDTGKESQDLQLQVASADKKLRETVQFLELQASEREAERDETQRELISLRNQLAQKERDCAATELITQEKINVEILAAVEQLEHRMREMTKMMEESDLKKQETERELKEAIDKVWTLRDIIQDLEAQLDARTQAQLNLQNQIEELQAQIKAQHRNNEELANELDSLKSLPDNQQLVEHADHLEKDLAEYKKFGTVESLTQMKLALDEIESTLFKKTKDLEFLHAFVSSNSCSSPSEDISAAEVIRDVKKDINFFEPLEIVRRLNFGIQKHTRVECAAIKRIKDLEMQMDGVNQKYLDLQVERDVLQGRLSEQLSEISTLQMRLDEQRRSADSRAKQSTISLENEIFDLKSTNRDLTEQVNTQDKQLKQMTNLLDKTKAQLLETEKEVQALANKHKETNSYYKAEIRKLLKEIDKVKSENKANMSVIPELMDNLLADKNAEMDLLKSELLEKSNLIEQLSSEGKNSARTLSDVVSISEFDEPDVLRKASSQSHQFELSKPNDVQDCSVQPLEVAEIPSLKLDSSEKRVQFSDESLISSLNEEIFQLKNDMAKIIADYKAKEILETELKSKIQQLELAVTAKQKEFDEYKAILRELETDYETKVTELDKCKVEVDDLRDLLRVKDDENFKISKNLENKLVQCDSLSLDCEELQRIIREKQNLIGELEERNLKNEEDLDRMREGLQEKLEAVKVLESKILDRSMYESLTQNINTLNTKITEQNDIITEYETKLVENEKLYDTKLAEANSQIQNLSTNSKLQNIEELNLKIQEQTNLIKDYEKRLVETEKQNDNSQSDRQSEVQRLTDQVLKLQQDILAINCDMVKTGTEVRERDSLILKQNMELESLREEVLHLQDYLKEKDRIIYQMTEDSNNLKTSLELIQNKMRETGNIIDLAQKLKEEQRISSQLREEIEILKTDNSNPKEFSELEEITGLVQKELDYAEQLDSSILSAIEKNKSKKSSPSHQRSLQKVDNFNIEVTPSDTKQNLEKLHQEIDKLTMENNNLTEDLKKITSCNQELLNLKDSLISELDEVRKQLNNEKDNCVRFQKLLVDERQNSNDLQIQDTNIIEQMRLKLEKALDNEVELETLIENEKQKRHAMSEELRKVQEQLELALNPENSLTLIQQQNRELKNALENKENDLSVMQAKYIALKQDFEDFKRLNADSDNAEHLQKVDQIIEENVKLKILKSELKSRVKDLMEKLEKSQELVKRTHQENLEKQKKDVAEVEHRIELMKSEEKLNDAAKKMQEMEKENRLISIQVIELKRELKTSREHENRLTDLLAKEREIQLKSPGANKFIEKINEIKSLLDSYVKENGQMASTLRQLTEERQSLQQRIKYLESQQPNGTTEQNHSMKLHAIFAKYLRAESFRKSLVIQKEVLLKIVHGYEANRKPIKLFRKTVRNKITFKTLAISVIAIFRMKFLFRRWSTGVRISDPTLRRMVPPLEIAQGEQIRAHSSRVPTMPTTPVRQSNTSWSGASPPCKDYSSQPFYLLSSAPKDYSTNPQYYSLVPPNQYKERFDKIEQRLEFLQLPRK